MPTPNDKPAPHWGGDEVTVEGVQLTPEGEAFIVEYAEHRRLLPEGAVIESQEAVKGYPVTTYSVPGLWRRRVALVFGWLRGNR